MTEFSGRTPTSTTSTPADHHRTLWLQGWAKCLFCDLERRGCDRRSPTLIAELNQSFLSFLLDFVVIFTIDPILAEEFQMLGRSIYMGLPLFPKIEMFSSISFPNLSGSCRQWSLAGTCLQPGMLTDVKEGGRAGLSCLV